MRLCAAIPLLFLCAAFAADDADQRVRELLSGHLLNDAVRGAAQEEFVALGEPAAWALLPYLAHDAIYVHIAVRDTFLQLGEAGAPALRHAAEQAPERQRRMALYLLARLGSTADVPLFAQAARDQDWRVRVLAARGIGAASAADMDAATDLLRPLTRDDDADVRRWAAVGLREMGTARATPALTGLLGDASFQTRYQAREALRALCPRGATHEVRAAVLPLLQPHVNQREQIGALRVLQTAGRRADARAVAALAQAADPALRAAALETLIQIDPRRARRLAQRPDDNPRVKAIGARLRR